MEIQDVMRFLAKRHISTSMKYDVEKDAYYVDLETNAKSHLYLYEDGTLFGRYNYETQIDLSQNEEDLITALCSEFSDALHGRGYCQQAWRNLCEEKGIKLEIYW